MILKIKAVIRYDHVYSYHKLYIILYHTNLYITSNLFVTVFTYISYSMS